MRKKPKERQFKPAIIINKKEKKSEKPEWYCLKVAFRILKEVDASDKINTEIHQIFGKDLIECKTISKITNHSEANGEKDEYIFVKVRNYADHMSEVRSSKNIVMTLGGSMGAEPIDEKDVIAFCENADSRLDREYKEGDLVYVCSGKFRDLHGIVHKVLGNGLYKVFFRFYSCCCFETIEGSALSYKASVADQWKFPVVNMKWPTFLQFNAEIKEESQCRD